MVEFTARRPGSGYLRRTWMGTSWSALFPDATWWSEYTKLLQFLQEKHPSVECVIVRRETQVQCKEIARIGRIVREMCGGGIPGCTGGPKCTSDHK